MHYILNEKREAVAVDLMTWAKWFETADRLVALNQVGKASVSTVFLGIDHQYGDGPPLLFETMVFDGGDEQDCVRYSTWAEAEAGHEAMIKEWKSK